MALRARRGRPIPSLTLTDGERTRLEQWARRRSTAQALALRSRIVLAAARGESNQAVAEQLGVSQQTVGKWRRRFLARRLGGLSDEPRPGVPPTITDAQVEWVIAKTLEGTPEDAPRWSTRSMAAVSGLSRSSISRIWRASGLQPHRVEPLKVSIDPFLVDGARDIVGLYLDPPERAAVLCGGEMSPIRASARRLPVRALRAKLDEPRPPDHERRGRAGLFAAYGVITGEGPGQPHGRRRAQDFAQFLRRIEATVPADREVRVILDHCSTQKVPAIHRWLLHHPRFHLQFAWSSSSWLNLVESWCSGMGEEADIRDWIGAWHQHAQPFVWVKAAGEIPTSSRFYRRISET
jgi:transposase